VEHHQAQRSDHHTNNQTESRHHQAIKSKI